MEKKSVFSKIILFLCFIALVVNVVETNQIRLQTKSISAESLIQKIMYNFPIYIKLNQKITNDNNAEIIIKDKNFAEKIIAPITKVEYNLWGEPYRTTNSYNISDANNRFLYVNANIKSLFKKQQNLNSLVKAKIIYLDKYEFECFALKTTKDKTDFTTNISLMPLQSEEIYFVTEMPKDFVNSKGSIYLELLVGNNKYVMKLR